MDHHGFEIAKTVTAANCRSCHDREYQQYLRSRHAAPSWAAVFGEKSLTPEQVEFSEQFQPGGCKRPQHPLVGLEGQTAAESGCASCHSVGKPNADGTLGTCTACHARHNSSVELARQPTTCGQCHMGPDHSQLEIYEESKHGVLFHAQEKLLNLAAEPKQLTTRDMFVPTCATCHMSGLNGLAVTHDPMRPPSVLPLRGGQREAAELRAGPGGHEGRLPAVPHAAANRCASTNRPRRWSAETNEKVEAAKAIVDGLRKDGVLSDKPFQTPIDFAYFDLWHYDGRTAKHGAFMGGADFVQWHGNYPMLQRTVQMKATADEMRRRHGRPNEMVFETTGSGWRRSSWSTSPS